VGIKRGREEHKSQVLGNELLRKIFASKKNAEVRSGRVLHDEVLCNIYRSFTLILVLLDQRNVGCYKPPKKFLY
jgi:hypothetical protein